MSWLFLFIYLIRVYILVVQFAAQYRHLYLFSCREDLFSSLLPQVSKESSTVDEAGMF
jgi:hypothetical protein